MRQIVSVFCKDDANVGDRMCCPERYFPYESVLSRRLENVKEDDVAGRTVIVGGGGLVDFGEKWDAQLRMIAKRAAVSIAWGVGVNNGERMWPWYSSLDGFTIVGCRDWGSRFEWVPCASCMAAEFDIHRLDTIETPVVAYRHRTVELGVHGVPEMRNDAPFDEVLPFLASGRTVLTNTYHGAYWATLLGRRVVIVKPFSNRFLFLHHRHVVSCAKDALVVAEGKKTKEYGNALAQCRRQNWLFWEMVRGVA